MIDPIVILLIGGGALLLRRKPGVRAGEPVGKTAASRSLDQYPSVDSPQDAVEHFDFSSAGGDPFPRVGNVSDGSFLSPPSQQAEAAKAIVEGRRPLPSSLMPPATAETYPIVGHTTRPAPSPTPPIAPAKTTPTRFDRFDADTRKIGGGYVR